MNLEIPRNLTAPRVLNTHKKSLIWWNIVHQLGMDIPRSKWHYDHRCSISFVILKPKQNGYHFVGNIFKRIFLDETVLILIKILPNLQQTHHLNQWGPSLSTHICFIQLQCVNTLKLSHNDRHDANGILKYVLNQHFCVGWFYWKLLSSFLLTKIEDWYRWWLYTEKAMLTKMFDAIGRQYISLCQCIKDTPHLSFMGNPCRHVLEG